MTLQRDLISLQNHVSAKASQQLNTKNLSYAMRSLQESNQILLEPVYSNSKMALPLSACLAKASAIELSSGFSKSFHNTFNTSNESVSAIQTEQNISEVCAISDKGIKPQFSRNSRNGKKAHSNFSTKPLSGRCPFCGSSFHPRR